MNNNLIYTKFLMRTSLAVCAIALSTQLLCAESVLGQNLKENNIRGKTNVGQRRF
ncbi:MAG: hypothetical protein LBV72_18615 [Tannerella sp.]|nr:hypothetical protein [Tannerella sp.]